MGERFADEWPMVAVGLWYGHAYVMDNETQVHFIDGILNVSEIP